MIITRLWGGLGNQMFQYAIARSLAYINNSEFKMDISYYKTQDLRNYELNCFNIIEKFATEKEVKKTISYKAKPYRLLIKILRLPSKHLANHYKEKMGFNFDPDILKIKNDVYLDGYWQTEKYFKNIREIIREEFTVKSRPNKQNSEILNEIQNSNSIAIHIRRGDYVFNPKILEIHGLCSLEYYKNGLEILKEKVSNPRIFVFSDDSHWVKENMDFGESAIYVTHNDPDKGYEDLRLMKNCKHFIIANSSFSWWGAWLSTNPSKLVIAPKRWMKDESYIVKDHLPENWIKI